MSIISALQTYLKTYSGLETDAPVWVDMLSPAPTEYTIIPLAGTKIAENYIDGSSLREYPFAFRSSESTMDDLERLENAGFYETFADWLDTQTNAGTLPILGTGQTAESIEATGWAYLYEQGQSDTGIYQIQLKLVYKQDPS